MRPKIFFKKRTYEKRIQIKWDIKSLFLFALTQGTFLQFWTPNSLRGYGCGTPNGSLWFICVLIQFYIVIVILYKLLKNKKTYVWIITFISSVLISIFGYEIVKLFNNEILDTEILTYINSLDTKIFTNKY